MRLRRRQPADPDAVQLVVAGVGPFRARVWHAQPGVADLSLESKLATGGLDGREATLVAVTGAQIQGRLECGWRPGHLRFLRDDVQRREHPRVGVVVPALLVPDRMEGIWRATTRDVGAGGTLVRDAADVPLGARLEVLLELADDDPAVRARGRVVRAPGTDLRAVRFEALGGEDRLRLQRFVAVQHVRRLNPGDGS